MISMLGTALLNETIINNNMLSAGKLLEILRVHVKSSLQQTGEDDIASDGMDLAFCIIDTQKNQLQYSGANNPLYIIRNKKLIMLNPTENPIGIYINEISFLDHIAILEPDDSIYMFSDGYYDQFGGKNNSKLYRKKFNQLLVDISTKPMNEQKDILEKFFYDWKGLGYQVDDVLVMGFRV